jgi:hypothetical protein
MENFKMKNKNIFEAGGKREAGGDDKLTFFYGALIKILHFFKVLRNQLQ